jgi:hypothetical protein
MSEPNFENENERLVAEHLSWPLVTSPKSDPASVLAAKLEFERKIREAHALTADEIAQIRAIGRSAARGTWFTEWGWEANMHDHWLGLYSSRRKHILQAHHALREAGWTASIERDPYDPGWNNRRWVPEFVKIHGINYWSWE